MSIFPGVPLIESPLFDPEMAEWGLSPQEQEVAIQLNRNGFAVIDFPDPAIMDRMGRIKDRLTSRFGLSANGVDHVSMTGEKRVQDAWQFDEDVREIATNANLLALLTKLYGRRAFPFQTLNFPVGTQQALHTDTVHFSSIPERFMCGVWLAMEDVGENSGPLTYVSGSHKWPIMSNGLIGRRGWKSELRSAQHPYEQAWRAMIDQDGGGQERLLAHKGQALIWCANLLHGGSRRLDRRLTRWSQVTHYYFEDCIYYTPAYSDEPLGRLSLREVVDVSTGETVPNRYLGETVRRSHPAWHRVQRWTRAVREVWRSLFSAS